MSNNPIIIITIMMDQHSLVVEIDESFSDRIRAANKYGYVLACCWLSNVSHNHLKIFLNRFAHRSNLGN